jgi:protein SERAC1
MLVHSNNSANKHIEEIVSCTKAIAFLGTPHCGSKMADWGKVVGNVINLIKTTNVDIIRVLKPDSEDLATIRESFLTMLRGRLQQNGQVVKITCFWEELPVPHVGEVSQQCHPQGLFLSSTTHALKDCT